MTYFLSLVDDTGIFLTVGILKGVAGQGLGCVESGFGLFIKLDAMFCCHLADGDEIVISCTSRLQPSVHVKIMPLHVASGVCQP